MSRAATPRGDRRRVRPPSPFGSVLRYWRGVRRLSQLDLAMESGLSPRHVCFVETGRAQPSRDTVLALAGTMDVPLRDRNALLVAAGYAPIYSEAPPDLTREDLAPVRHAFEAILRQQEPYPAVVMNRHWDIVMTNLAARRFFSFLLEGTSWEGPSNVIRMMFSPQALQPFVTNWDEVAPALIQRVRREAVGGVLDAPTRRLLEEVLAPPGAPLPRTRPGQEPSPLPVIPVTFARDSKTFRFFSTITTLGTPQDIHLQELRIECFFPLDNATRAQAEEMARQLGTARPGPMAPEGPA